MACVDRSTKVTGGLLGVVERPLLGFLVRVLPARVTPDWLTGIGFFGALVTAAGYLLTNVSVAFLWLASFGLLINWMGDSLDGTLARFRGIERPQFGFYVDHITDLGAEILVGLSFGLSSFLKFDIACIALIAYLAFSVFTFIRTIVTGSLHISFGGVGPTEVRIALIVSNALLFWFPPHVIVTLWEPMTAVDLFFLAFSVIELTILIVLAIGEGRRLWAQADRGLL